MNASRLRIATTLALAITVTACGSSIASPTAHTTSISVPLTTTVLTGASDTPANSSAIPISVAPILPVVTTPSSTTVAPRTTAKAAPKPAATTAAVAPVAPAPPAETVFANCTAMHQVYPHGVGRAGAVDHVSGTSKPVTDFYVDTALYNANAGSDADGDGIACEKQ